MNDKMIAKLEAKGFKRWTKETSRGTIDRLYLNAQACGLELTYYKTGNVSSAHFNGEQISNAEGRRMYAQKTYIDLKDDSVHSDYWNDTFLDIAQALIDEAAAEIEAEEQPEEIAEEIISENEEGEKEVKKNVVKEVEGMAQIARMCNVSELVVTKESTWASAQYKPIEMVRGDFDIVLDWCLAHQDDPEFDTDSGSQYVVSLAGK